jgi:methionyl-tRNA formyltransferase
MNVLLVGEESAGAQTLKLLANSNHRLVGVMASPTRKAVGGMTVWQRAEQLGCRMWPAESVKDPAFAELIRAEEVDLLLNVHSLFVIKPEIVAAPRWGSFNLHPGPLPRYAGLNAPSWAIYRGERSHGVTLHRMLAGIDTGAIAYQTLFDVEETDTGLSVSAKCIKFGMELIRKLLETAAENPRAIPAIEQDAGRREYFGKGTPEDGWLDTGRARPARLSTS